MHPFWDPVISPLLRVCGGKRIVEIGALRGETTKLMLDDLGPDSEVHVIDPVPAFDPGEHERQFPGRYVFHRDLSLNVLGDLDPFDVALIDGDHNWYSVYNEMRLLAENARRAGQPMPISILHDVGWPYGRRDLYYEPDNIPAEHRQPFEHLGMRPGRAPLLKGGGMNHTLANAAVEGGERNGVRTGMEDFIAGYDRPLRCVLIPIYFGLAIVVEHETLERQPELAALLDHLESPEGTAELLELSESIRLDGVVFQHNVDRVRAARLDRAIERHLTVLRTSSTAPESEIAGIDDAVRFVVEHPETLGDVVYAGSAQGLHYLASALDSHELDNRGVVAIGPDLAGVAAEFERVEHIAGADSASQVDDRVIATVAAATDADSERVRSVLGDGITVGSVVSDADRQSVR